MKIDKIINLQRNNRRYLERVNKLLEMPKAHSILRCLGVYPEELQHSLPVPIDVDLIYTLIGYVEECERVAKIEALNHALEYMGQFPDFNLTNMYEYIKDKEEELKDEY